MGKDPTRPEFEDFIEATSVDRMRVLPAQEAGARIAVDLIHVSEVSQERPWRAVQVFTNNTAYSLDHQLVCVDISSSQGRSPDHLLGAQLVGGQIWEDDHFSVAFPLPVPGMQAVFRLPNSGSFLTTSAVQRVIQRVRVTNLDLASGQTPDWNRLTSEWTVG